MTDPQPLNRVAIDLLALAAEAWANGCPTVATRLTSAAWEVVAHRDFVDDDTGADR